MSELALLAGAGALVSLDAVHVAQVMLSRPVVVGPIAGWFLGDVGLGLRVGALVELVWISVLPIGPYTPPDATLSTLVAVSAADAWGGGAAAAALGIAAAVPVGIAGRRIDMRLRRRMTSVSERVSADLEIGRPPGLGRAILAGLLGPALKTFVLVLAAGAAALALAPAARALLDHAPTARGLAAAAALLPAVGIAMVADILEVRLHRVAVLAGALAAAIVWGLAR